MLWTARRVASLPGAVLHIPAMPVAAFLLMVAGGAVAGAVADALAALRRGADCRRHGAGAGFAAARYPDRPRRRARCRARGRRAARGRRERHATPSSCRAGSRTTAMRARRAMRRRAPCHLRPHRLPRDASRVSRWRWRSIPPLSPTTAGAPRSWSRKIVSPRSCAAPKAVVDFFAARREGTHAIYIEDDGTLRVETVAASPRPAPVVGANKPAARQASRPVIPCATQRVAVRRRHGILPRALRLAADPGQPLTRLPGCAGTGAG